MLKLLIVLPAALLFALLPQEPPAADKPMPADAATLTNPVKPTQESQAHAKMMFGIDCAMCHGANGNGKGDLVEDMHLTMKDLTGEGDRAKDDYIWNLVIYVRGLAKK